MSILAHLITGYYPCNILTRMTVYIRRDVFKFWKLVANLGQCLIDLGGSDQIQLAENRKL